MVVVRSNSNFNFSSKIMPYNWMHKPFAPAAPLTQCGFPVHSTPGVKHSLSSQCIGDGPQGGGARSLRCNRHTIIPLKYPHSKICVTSSVQCNLKLSTYKQTILKTDVVRTTRLHTTILGFAHSIGPHTGFKWKWNRKKDQYFCHKFNRRGELESNVRYHFMSSA